MGGGAVDLGFAAVPFAVGGVGSQGGAAVGEDFFVVDAAELVARVGVVLFVFLADGGAERAAADVPEFGHFHALRIDFQGSAH